MPHMWSLPAGSCVPKHWDCKKEGAWVPKYCMRSLPSATWLLIRPFGPESKGAINWFCFFYPTDTWDFSLNMSSNFDQHYQSKVCLLLLFVYKDNY